jgi:hypothetical protein
MGVIKTSLSDEARMTWSRQGPIRSTNFVTTNDVQCFNHQIAKPLDLGVYGQFDILGSIL